MQEAKFLFETGVGRCDTGEWCWAARGRDMEEFFRDWERLPVSPSGDGNVSRCIVGHICVLAGGGEDGVASSEGDGRPTAIASRGRAVAG